MSKYIPFAAALLLASACAAPVTEAPPTGAEAPPTANPSVGGSPMYPSYSIVQNASNSKDHTTLVAAVRAAGLAETLSGSGPYTLFAPTNDAFGRLPRGTMEALMAPGNKILLARVLNYHVVPGRKTRSQIVADSQAGGGSASYRTAEGTLIRVAVQGNSIIVTDVHGNRSSVSIGDVMQANGVMHVLDGVLLPRT
jgi:uncharacterized surface protein with fasciclin (FAS1) repeats